jgi:uncharacterized protein (TIGR03084 family)
VDPVVGALAAEQAELSGVLDGLAVAGGLADAGWHAPTRCEGWDVADVVLHLAQTNEMAIASAEGNFAEMAARLTDVTGRSSTVDAGAERMVQVERGLAIPDLLARWSSSATRLIDALERINPSERVAWVVGDLSARTLATTRLAETWIHAGDVAGALGITLPPPDRLRPIARLAWRTLPYAFASAALQMKGPVAFLLTSPGGEAWDFLPDQPALTTISGPGAELCAVAARRVDPSATSLRGEGPDAGDVLALVRTYA